MGLTRPVETLDGTGRQGDRRRVGMNEFLYAYVPASAVVGEIYIVTYNGDEETCPKLVAAATAAFYQETAIVLKDQGSSAGFAWVQTAGKSKMLVEGTTDVAKDDFLEVLNTEKSVKKDGTTRTVNSVAIACEAQAANSAVLIDCIKIGGRTITAAS